MSLDHDLHPHDSAEHAHAAHQRAPGKRTLTGGLQRPPAFAAGESQSKAAAARGHEAGHGAAPGPGDDPFGFHLPGSEGHADRGFDSGGEESVQLAHLARQSSATGQTAGEQLRGPDAGATPLRSTSSDPEANVSQIDPDLAPDAASGGAGGEASARTASNGASGAQSSWQKTLEKKRAKRGDRGERKLKNKGEKKSARSADSNRFNRAAVKARQRKSSKQFQRAGVRFDGRDKFEIKATATRYRIDPTLPDTDKDGKKHNRTAVADILAGGITLAINPAHSRELNIAGIETHCVLTWHDTHGSAWLPVKDLKVKKSGDGGKIAKAADRLSREWKPRKASADELKNAAHFTFDGVRSALAAGERDHYIMKNQRGKDNHESDYLGGKPNGLLNVVLNLPRKGTAPVAVDVVTDIDHFFVPHTSDAVKEVPLYKGKSSTVQRLQTWVFGYVGKTNATGGFEPDEKRRGWVPIRVLKPAP